MILNSSEQSHLNDLGSSLEYDIAASCQKYKEQNRKQSIIANLSINSLPNKFEEVKEWLGCKAIDILLIQETKIDRTFPNSQFHIDGYKLFRRDRAQGGGGILIYTNGNIIATKITISCKSLEAIVLDMQIGKRRFALISAYKPPNVDNNTLNTDCAKYLIKHLT